MDSNQAIAAAALASMSEEEKFHFLSNLMSQNNHFAVGSRNETSTSIGGINSGASGSNNLFYTSNSLQHGNMYNPTSQNVAGYNSLNSAYQLKSQPSQPVSISLPIHLRTEDGLKTSRVHSNLQISKWVMEEPFLLPTSKLGNGSVLTNLPFDAIDAYGTFSQSTGNQNKKKPRGV